MARPEDYPFWATNDETDPTYGTPNKVIPTTEKQDYGQRGNKNTLRQDINYLFNRIREWIQFFDEQYAVGDVYSTSDLSTVPADLNERLGGTWEFIDAGTGDDTLGGVPVKVFDKIV